MSHLTWFNCKSEKPQTRCHLNRYQIATWKRRSASNTNFRTSEKPRTNAAVRSWFSDAFDCLVCSNSVNPVRSRFFKSGSGKTSLRYPIERYSFAVFQGLDLKWWFGDVKTQNMRWTFHVKIQILRWTTPPPLGLGGQIQTLAVFGYKCFFLRFFESPKAKILGDFDGK